VWNPNDRDNASLRGFLAIFDLAQIVKLVWISFKTQYVDIDFLVVCSRSVTAISVLGRTPRDYRDFTQPPEFEYAIY
jgi:calcium permeable stress-gated cation channel